MHSVKGQGAPELAGGGPLELYVGDPVVETGPSGEEASKGV